jgi:AcrR family transcriptional regulator
MNDVITQSTKIKRERGETTALILEAASALLADEGYESFSMRRLADRVGYSAAALYRHFPNKSALIGAIAESGYARILSALEGAIASNPRPDEALAAMVRAYVDFALSSPKSYEAVMLRAPAELADRVDVLGSGISARRRSFAFCTEVLSRGMREGSLAERDVELAAQSTWVAMFGLALRLIREPGISPERRSLLVEETIRTLLDGVRSRGAAEIKGVDR